MDSTNFIIKNWNLIIPLLLGASGGGGWLGWLLSSRSRNVELHSKIFKINSEMIDGIKADFEDQINYLKTYISNLIEANKTLNNLVEKLKVIVSQQEQVILKQKKIIEQQEDYIKRYQGKYGTLN